MAEKKKLNLKGVPVIYPDDEVMDTDPADLPDALRQGGKIAQVMADENGDRYWEPVDEIEKAMSEGLHLLARKGGEFVEYPEGEEPVITGHNEKGEPIWGTKETQPEGFWKSAGEALLGIPEGIGGLFDPRANEFERTHPAWNTPLAAAGGPITRLIEPQVAMGERFATEAEQAGAGGPDATQHGLEAARHFVGAAVPLVGPMVVGTQDRMVQQMAEGDNAGALGTELGTMATVPLADAAMRPVETVGAVRNAAGSGAEYLRGKWRAMNAPSSRLNTPVAPGDLTPLERYNAAQGMGVNLDRAQATGANLPGTVKKFTEHSLGGRGTYEENRATNVEALHNEADRILNDAGTPEEGAAPQAPLSREALGARAQQSLKAHEAQLSDRPGQEADVNALLDAASPNKMTRVKFGDAIKGALEKDLEATTNKENAIYAHLDSEFAADTPDMRGIRDKARNIYRANKRFFEKYGDNLPSGDRTVWNWVKKLGDIDKSGNFINQTGGDTWSELQHVRSSLLQLTRGPEIISKESMGWLEQLTGTVDDAMTNPRRTQGMTAAEQKLFRDANELHKGLKETYDSNQSPFYWLIRKGGLDAADRVDSFGPEDAGRLTTILQDAGRKDLVGQWKRQTMSRLFDPAGNGEIDLPGFSKRWPKVQKEEATAILGPGTVTALDGISDRAARETVYDTPGSQLRRVMDAPDGTSAAQAMFNDSGKLLLTPEEVRQVTAADGSLIPMLRREAVSRLFDPTAKGAPDLENFSARWGRAQKESLQGLLTPEQMTDLDNLASVSRAVNLKSNPSGTAVVMQPAEEASGLAQAAGRMGPATVGGLVGSTHGAEGAVIGAAAGELAGRVADTVGKRIAAKRMVNPEATADIMTGPRPTAAQTAGTISNAVTAAAPKNLAEAAPGALIAGAGAGQTQQNAGDKFRTMTAARRNPYEGVSTPPNGGQVTDVEHAEPNEVHDEAAAQRAMAAQAQQGGEVEDTHPGAPALPSDGSRVAEIRDSRGSVIYQAPEGATHEVLHPETGNVIGHYNADTDEYTPVPN